MPADLHDRHQRNGREVRDEAGKCDAREDERPHRQQRDLGAQRRCEEPAAGRAQAGRRRTAAILDMPTMMPSVAPKVSANPRRQPGAGSDKKNRRRNAATFIARVSDPDARRKVDDGHQRRAHTELPPSTTMAYVDIRAIAMRPDGQEPTRISCSVPRTSAVRMAMLPPEIAMTW